ncbi:MAG: hypothetical protein KGH79_04350, partial [Patescibacteria group bacterium]|nr:hypothetical protein [Patescibacteria group bacterium]
TGATTQTLQDRVKSDSATVKDPINKNTYYLGYHPYEGVTDPTASDNPPYLIAYDDSNQSFTISLLQEPLAATRSTVESYLMTHFSLTQDQMCSLRYIISTPYRVNQVYAGTNLGFSFCAGATKL